MYALVVLLPNRAWKREDCIPEQMRRRKISSVLGKVRLTPPRCHLWAQESDTCLFYLVSPHFTTMCLTRASLRITSSLSAQLCLYTSPHWLSTSPEPLIGSPTCSGPRSASPANTASHRGLWIILPRPYKLPGAASAQPSDLLHAGGGWDAYNGLVSVLHASVHAHEQVSLQVRSSLQVRGAAFIRFAKRYRIMAIFFG